MRRVQAYNLIGEIFETVRKKKWKCLHSNCNKIAINSHLGQQNGILSKIQDEGHVYQVKPTNAHHWNKKLPFKFKKLGVRQALSWPIFCNDHDDELFKYIENKNLVLTDYRTFLSFSYRTISSEIRKKEIGIEKNNQTINSFELDGEIDKNSFERANIGLEYGIKLLEKLQDILANEINIPTNAFKYYCYELPRYDLFISTVMTVIPNELDGIEIPENYNLYIHFIPRKGKTILLIGYHKDYNSVEMKDYCLSWNKSVKEEIDLKLTDLLSNHIENWAISPELHSKL